MWSSLSNRLPGMVQGALIFCLGLSLAVLGLYLLGSGFTDTSLLFLLRVLRYLSFLVCLLSLCAMAFGIRGMIEKPRFRQALGIILYFASGTAGALLVLACAFMLAASGGNG
jgi:hypothetical protein